jgi:hypothetical protein
MSVVDPGSPLRLAAGKRVDTRVLAAKVFERHGIALKEDDPAFALVTLNELILRELMNELLKDVDQHMVARLAEFEQTIRRVEVRACKVLAQQIKDVADGFRETLQKEIAGAVQLSLQRMLEEVRRMQGSGILTHWYIRAGVALGVFACGFWAGRF